LCQEEETRQAFTNEKELLSEHREKLKAMILSCKALYDEFDGKRREIKAEKAKRIRELTDPDHAWGADFSQKRFYKNPFLKTFFHKFLPVILFYRFILLAGSDLNTLELPSGDFRL
jgi:hypothetical protein